MGSTPLDVQWLPAFVQLSLIFVIHRNLIRPGLLPLWLRVAHRYSAVQSQGWYLEDIHLTTTWESFYANEPLDGIDDPAAQARVLGGETCMWGEYIDGSQLLNTAWPRAAAAAERLWSPRHFNQTAEARPRLARFRCLLETRGIPAGTLGMEASPYGLPKAGQPPKGPGSCYSQ